VVVVVVVVVIARNNTYLTNDESDKPYRLMHGFPTGLRIISALGELQNREISAI
jgi:hypothetical protein